MYVKIPDKSLAKLQDKRAKLSLEKKTMSNEEWCLFFAKDTIQCGDCHMALSFLLLMVFYSQSSSASCCLQVSDKEIKTEVVTV